MVVTLLERLLESGDTTSQSTAGWALENFVIILEKLASLPSLSDDDRTELSEEMVAARAAAHEHRLDVNPD